MDIKRISMYHGHLESYHGHLESYLPEYDTRQLDKLMFYYLWPPYGIGQAIIFLPCGFYLSYFLSFYLFFLA